VYVYLKSVQFVNISFFTHTNLIHFYRGKKGTRHKHTTDKVDYQLDNNNKGCIKVRRTAARVEANEEVD